jgi:GTP pyrophosphokinase
MCEKAFRKYKLNFNQLAKTDEMHKVVESFGLKGLEDLIISVGYGKITPLQVVRKIAPKTEEEHFQGALADKGEAATKKKIGAGVIVKGVEDILVRFGKCCQPVPGDAIVGFITRGFGVTIHRTNCSNVAHTNPERLIEVEWSKKTAETFPVKIVVRALDRMGLLADVAASISKCGANILTARSEMNNDKVVSGYFTLAVENTQQLELVLSGLKNVKQVQEVRRMG